MSLLEKVKSRSKELSKVNKKSKKVDGKITDYEKYEDEFVHKGLD